MAGALIAGSFLMMNRSEAAEPVVLEPLDQVQRDRFADDLDVATPPADLEVALPEVPQLPADDSSGGAKADGATAGLYGGSRDTGVCDVAKLVAFLGDPANAAKASAWANVLGIGTGDIPSYAAGLTPVRLRFDTLVTNHGFRDGAATAFQSVLQAGTAVLVDADGVPRAKCNCGNPLTEPTGGDPSHPLNPDDAWPGYDPDKVVTVRPGDPVPAFVLVDLVTGEAFRRPVGSIGDDDQPVAADDPDCATLGGSPTCPDSAPPPSTTTIAPGAAALGGESDPAAAARAYAEATYSGDCARGHDLTSANALAAIGMSRDDRIAACESEGPPPGTVGTFEVRSVAGDTAIVHVTGTDQTGPVDADLHMVREDDSWKVDFLNSEF
jgi:hypothetical protein